MPDQIVLSPPSGHKPTPAALAADQVIGELVEWSQTTGRPLPMPAGWIASLEAAGHVVDLITGEWWIPEPAPARADHG